MSADIGIVFGKTKTWIFDVGNGAEYIKEINALSADKSVVISHFHPDHMGNLPAINFKECFVGKNTFKYSKTGTIVEKDLYIEDGIRLHIFPIPSSHAKGSLGLEVNEEYAFIGDAAGPALKPDKRVYNAQLLIEEIKVFEALKAQKILCGHEIGTPADKQEIINKLKDILSKRKDNEAYIEI